MSVINARVSFNLINGFDFPNVHILLAVYSFVCSVPSLLRILSRENQFTPTVENHQFVFGWIYSVDDRKENVIDSVIVR